MADDPDDDPARPDPEFREFPKWLHRWTPATAPVPPVDPRMHGVTTETVHNRTLQVDLVYQAGIVDTAEVEADLEAVGWVPNVLTARQAALEAIQREQAVEEARQEAIAAARQEQQDRKDEERLRRVLRDEVEKLTRAIAVRPDQPDVDLTAPRPAVETNTVAPTDDGPPLTLKAAATLLGVSEDTVGRMVANGRIRTVILGKRPKVPVAEVRRLLALPKFQFPDHER